MTQHETATESRRRRTSGLGECFVYGALGFEILADFDFALDPGHRELASVRLDSPSTAWVRCAVRRDPVLDQGSEDRTIRWAVDAQGALEVATRGARARVIRLGPSDFVATASVGTTSSAPSCLATALSTALTFAQGGFVLHATAVEIEGRAFLFVGPSGAGKTTTANQLRDARWIARDRATVVPIQSRWMASGLAGGDELEIHRSDRRSTPLAGIFRVVRADERSHVEPLDPAVAVHVLRESIQTAATTTGDEVALVDRALALSSAVPVARLHVALGDRFEPLLAAFDAETVHG